MEEEQEEEEAGAAPTMGDAACRLVSAACNLVSTSDVRMGTAEVVASAVAAVAAAEMAGNSASPRMRRESSCSSMRDMVRGPIHICSDILESEFNTTNEETWSCVGSK